MRGHLAQKLDKRFLEGNHRTLRTQNPPIDFASNDTLGLSKKIGWESNMQRWGATGSRLLTGNSVLIECLENQIATYHEAETGLLFSSGYLANLGLLSTVATENDTVIYDAHIHASSRDGLRLSRARTFHFRHNDVHDLERLLNRQSLDSGQLYVCIESLYSCDGSCAPLTAINTLCKQFRAKMIVDEAHATGVFGHQGKGLVNHSGCQNDVFARIHTFGKAVGVCGAIVLGSALLRETLINFSRPFIYTTALPDPVIKAIYVAYRLMRESETERAHLQTLITYFINQMQHSKLQFYTSETHIQALASPGNLEARLLAQHLALQGIDAQPLLSPTIARGQERIRICLHSYNTIEDIDHLFTSLMKTLRG